MKPNHGSVTKLVEGFPIVSILVCMKAEDILKSLLPEYLVEYFDITKVYETPDETLHIEFEEKNVIPEEFSSRQYISKGFLPSITVEDFPLRGKATKLHIKRRRWMDKDSGDILKRDWNLVAKGTRMTTEFATFLKEISRYQAFGL